MSRQFDVAVVGAGIVGLAHAWMAAQRGLRVVIFDRHSAAQGASVRNFGMIWPIGQPSGEMTSIAMRSREFWMELKSKGVVWVEECGSLHLAHQPDELAVLEEFCDRTSHSVKMMSPQETCSASRLANPQGLLAGMYSAMELRVDPRTAGARIVEWLQEAHGVVCHFQTQIKSVQDLSLTASDGQQWTAAKIVICSNDDLTTLFPETLRNSGLRLCKLQMLKTHLSGALKPNEPHVAGGLTLRHYTSFSDCPSLTALKQRILKATPELDRFGIHVMASPFPNGDVILGDSHEYDLSITPFNKCEIDELILRELRKIIRLDNWTVTERWYGIYAKHASQPVVDVRIQDGVHAFVGTGGAGMTLAFGLADRAWRQWNGE